MFVKIYLRIGLKCPSSGPISSCFRFRLRYCPAPSSSSSFPPPLLGSGFAFAVSLLAAVSGGAASTSTFSLLSLSPPSSGGRRTRISSEECSSRGLVLDHGTPNFPLLIRTARYWLGGSVSLRGAGFLEGFLSSASSLGVPKPASTFPSPFPSLLAVQTKSSICRSKSAMARAVLARMVTRESTVRP